MEMSGHSKWSSIKHKKARVDAQRGKVFTKLIREIMVAARMGGGDPDLNPRLRLVVDKARGANMPWDNIERAIKKGTGELEGQEFESFSYEGYGPGGVAILVDVLTDNKNRTASEVRHTFSKYGGNLAGAGSVAWQFKAKGVIYIDKDKADEDTVLEIALEAGADDVKTEGNVYEIITEAKDFMAVKAAFEEKEIEVSQADLTKIPQNQVKLEGKEAERVLKLIDYLEELDDVQDVYANFDIPDEVLETLSG
jgi:YebC/PmpR family DNA-binding regulatory protein